jgi:hypothetical protein
MKLLVMGIHITTVEQTLGDKVCEPLAKELQRHIENAVKQIVYDLGENGSGHKLEVEFK